MLRAKRRAHMLRANALLRKRTNRSADNMSAKRNRKVHRRTNSEKLLLTEKNVEGQCTQHVHKKPSRCVATSDEPRILHNVAVLVLVGICKS